MIRGCFCGSGVTVMSLVCVQTGSKYHLFTLKKKFFHTEKNDSEYFTNLEWPEVQHFLFLSLKSFVWLLYCSWPWSTNSVIKRMKDNNPWQQLTYFQHWKDKLVLSLQGSVHSFTIPPLNCPVGRPSNIHAWVWFGHCCCKSVELAVWLATKRPEGGLVSCVDKECKYALYSI